jgi:hypothetical protein
MAYLYNMNGHPLKGVMIRIARNGVEVGRYTPEALWQLIQTKVILPTDDYLEDGSSAWKKVCDFQQPIQARSEAAITNSPSAKPKAMISLDAPGAKTGLQLTILLLICRLVVESYVAASIYAEARTLTGIMAYRMASDMKTIIGDNKLYVLYGGIVAASYLVIAILLIPLLRLIRAYGKPDAKRPSQYWTKFFG